MAADWLVYAGENEGHPLIVMLDRSFGRDHFDRSRPWAILVELPLPRVDGNALPVADDWPALEAIEAALVRELATDEDDWQYVVRTYGEGVCRFGFYAKRSSAAAARVQRVLNEFDGWTAKTTIHSDPKWSAYASFFPGDDGSERKPSTPELPPEIAPSFRDEPPTGPSSDFRRRAEPSPSSPNRRPYGQPYDGPRRGGYTPREEQPWRGEESQVHPDD